MFRATLCPSSGEQDRVLLHMVFCTGCAGCGCVGLGRKLCGQHTAYGVDGAARHHPHRTQRLSRPPPIQKLGAENHMLQLNI